MPSDKEAKVDFGRLGFDPLGVRGKEREPDLHFKWISTATKEQFGRQKAKGFVPVDRYKTKVTVDELDVSTDSSIRCGDLILCQMPKERYEALDRFNQQKGKANLKTSEHTFRQAVVQAEREVRDKGADVKSLIVEEGK